MLQAMRDRASGIVSWVIIGMLVLGFVFWQIGDYLGVGKAPSAVEINDDVIVENKWKEIYSRAISGKSLPTDPNKIREIKDSLINQLITSSVKYQQSIETGYNVGENLVTQRILSIPKFATDGKFDPYLYQKTLQLNGHNEQSFRALLGRNLYIEQLEYGIKGSEFISQKELAAILKAQYRSVDMEYLKISAKKFKKSILYNDSILEIQYKKNIKVYENPEKLQFSYVQISFADIEKEIKPDVKTKLTEADYKKQYEKTKNNYRTAALRKAAHIYFKLKKKAKKEEVAAVMLKAKKVYAELAKTKKFSVLVKKYSDDKFSPGGDLGVIDAKSSPVLFKAIEKLPKGAFTEPVISDSGIHILKVTFVKPGSVIAYAKVRDKIAKRLKSQRKNARRNKIFVEFKKRSERLDELTRDDDKSLDSAAEALGLKIIHSGWITRDGSDQKGKKVPGLAANEQVRRILFTNRDVFAEGIAENSENSSTIELNRDKKNALSVVVRLKAYQAKKAKSFEKVKEQVKDTFVKTESAKKTIALAKKLLKKLQEGKTIAVLAKANKLKVIKAKKISRASTKHPKNLLAAAFKLGIPGKKIKMLLDAVSLENGDAVLVNVLGTDDGGQKTLTKQVKVFHRQIHEQLIAHNLLTSVMDVLKSKADIVKNNRIIYSEDNEN